MTSIFHSGLSKDFSLILNDDDDFNIIIQVGENQNTKEFRHIQLFYGQVPNISKVLSHLIGL